MSSRALASDRRYAYHSIGALGVIELTAPGRVAQVDRGLARLRIDRRARRYFTLHATLDVSHSAAWNREVLKPVESGAKTVSMARNGRLVRTIRSLRTGVSISFSR